MLKALVLAAGQGSRLRPYTDCLPKALVEFNGQPLIDYQLTAFTALNINDVTVVTGYKSEQWDAYLGKVRVIRNNEYALSNMVYSLFVANNLFKGLDEDLIISYGDIIFEPFVLEKLMSTKGDVAVVSDKAWRSYWGIRMDDLEGDVESFKKSPEGRLLELGKKVESLDDVEGQYIGLIKVSHKFCSQLDYYNEKLMTDSVLQNRNPKQLYMTDFIQYLIDNRCLINVCEVNRGWLEFDTCDDMNKYNKLLNDRSLGFNVNNYIETI